MAAAAALSLTVHAAVLLGRASAGSVASSSARLAPVLLTRSVAAAAPITSEPPLPVPATTVPMASERVAVIEPLRPSPEPPAARAPLPAPVPSPLPGQADAPASAVLPTSPPQLALAPLAPPSPSPLTYLGSGGLDPPPRLLSDVDPAIPAEAGRRGGVVVLRLFINERGGVDKAEVMNSAPSGLFDASALEAFGAARFSPGYLAGVPVKSQVTFEMKFPGQGNGTAASSRTY